MYMTLMMLGRQKFIQLSNSYLNLVLLSLEFLLKLKRYKLPGANQILAEPIKARGGILCSQIHRLLIVFWIRKKCHRSGRNVLLHLFIKRVIKLLAYNILTIILLRLTPHVNIIIGDNQCGF
jgi:hypothetical protein